MSEAIDVLSSEYVEIAEAWQRTREAWRDSIAMDFERSFWTDLDERTREFLKECRSMDGFLSHAEAAVARLSQG